MVHEPHAEPPGTCFFYSCLPLIKGWNTSLVIHFIRVVQIYYILKQRSAEVIKEIKKKFKILFTFIDLLLLGKCYLQYVKFLSDFPP